MEKEDLASEQGPLIKAEEDAMEERPTAELLRDRIAEHDLKRESLIRMLQAATLSPPLSLSLPLPPLPWSSPILPRPS